MADNLAWDDLRLVLSVARGGSLRRAAADLGVDATTVGRRLAAIDDRLGYPLFERSGNALAVTPAARALVADLEGMEASAFAAQRKLASGAKRVTGVVRIATSESFGMFFLLGELRALADELPGIQVELVTAHAMVDLRKRDADIAVRFARPTAADLRVRRLADLRWSLYGSVDYLAHRPRPDLERGLAGHRMIAWSPALRPHVAAWLEANTGAAEIVLRSAHLHVVIEACAAGFGLAVMPGAMARSRQLVRAIDHAIDVAPVWMVVHSDLRKVPRVRAVAQWLAARLGASVDRMGAL